MTQSIIRTAAVTGVGLALGLGASACASHKFVRENLAVVDERVTTVDTRVTGVEGTAGQALERANAAHVLAEGKFLYEVVLSDDSVKFPVNRDALSPEAEQRLAELAQRVKGENRNVVKLAVEPDHKEYAALMGLAANCFDRLMNSGS